MSLAVVAVAAAWLAAGGLYDPLAPRCWSLAVLGYRQEAAAAGLASMARGRKDQYRLLHLRQPSPFHTQVCSGSMAGASLPFSKMVFCSPPFSVASTANIFATLGCVGQIYIVVVVQV